jgi:lysophospholipase L1-like esterase
MGDSITFGQYVDPQLRWTTLVTERLQQVYLETPVQIYALNRGVSGETTRQGLERFPTDVQQIGPDVMTLQFGLNDCNCWLTDGGLPRVSAAAFRANLLEMITRARRFGTRQIILANNHRTLRTKVMLSG